MTSWSLTLSPEEAEGSSQNTRLICCSGLLAIVQFTVVCLVAWPLNESEAGVNRKFTAFLTLE